MSPMLGSLERYVAQRPHKAPCDLCGEPIAVGQECERWTWLDDVPSTVRVHVACATEANQYEWFDDASGWPDTYPLREERGQAARALPPSQEERAMTARPEEGK